MPDSREHERLLSGLLDKYQTILCLREARATQTTVAARQAMRTLAARMPGSLRELQLVPIEVIRARLRSVERVQAAGCEPDLWMRLQGAYHGLLRASLRIRLLVRTSGRPPGEVQVRLLGYVAADDEPSSESFDAPALIQLVRPAGGRLHEWVIERVATEHSVAPEDVRKALFLPE